MRRALQIICFAASAVPLSCLVRAQIGPAPVFYLRNNDRVVFYGDSITAQRLYTRLVEGMIVSRYPMMHVEFFSAGVSGDSVRGGQDGDAQTRVTRDVAPFRPTVVTIMLGMNDGRMTTSNADENFSAYAEGYRRLIELLRKNSVPNVRFTLAWPSPYDEISEPAQIPGYNSVLLRYGSFVNALAAENRFAVADFNHSLAHVLTVATRENNVFAQELVPGHVHPSIWGHWVLAAEMVRAWGFDPLVSSVDLDAAHGTLIAAQKATVTAVTKTSTGLKWLQTDASLPLPLDLSDPFTHFLLQVSELEEIDQQVVRVGALDAGTYSLLFDGKAIGTFTSDQLAAGINLALYETPMEIQARRIDWDGAERRAKLSETRLSLMAQAPAIASANDAAAVLDELDAEMVRHEYECAKPRPHDIELRSVEKSARR